MARSLRAQSLKFKSLTAQSARAKRREEFLEDVRAMSIAQSIRVLGKQLNHSSPWRLYFYRIGLRPCRRLLVFWVSGSGFGFWFRIPGEVSLHGRDISYTSIALAPLMTIWGQSYEPFVSNTIHFHKCHVFLINLFACICGAL